MRLENCRPFSLKNFGLNYIGYFNIYYYSLLAKYNIEILYDAVYKIDISAARDIQIVMNFLKRRIILLNDAGINGLIQIPNRQFYGFSTFSLSLPSDSIEISSIKYDNNNDCYEFKSKIDNLIKLRDGEYVEGRLLYNINSILKIEKKLWSSYDYTTKFDNDDPGFHIFEANYNDEEYKDFIKNLRRISYHVCDYLNDAIQIILNRMTDTNEYYYICTMCSQVYYKSHILDLEDDKCQNCGAPSSQIIKYNFPLIEDYKYNFDIL